jgi:tetratricopeptide (TPR) repeat protein
VRRAGDQVRINAQLIDAETGAHLWAERFDGARSDLFSFQSEVTRRIAVALKHEMIVAEGARAARVPNPDATDLIYRARAIIAGATQGADLSEARHLLEEALRLDERSAQAWTMLAIAYTVEVRFSPSRDDDLRRAEQAIARALALDPRSADAHHRRGLLLYEQGRLHEALEEFQTALAIDPNRAPSEAQLAATQVVLGRPREAFPHIEAAMRLSPRDPFLSGWQMFGGVAHMQLGNDAAAVEWLRRSVALNPGSRFGRLFYASALALAGREEEARAQMAEFQRLAPGFTLTRMKQLEPSEEPEFLAQRQRIYEGLRRAGMPE